MAQQTAVEWLFAQIPLEFSSSRAAYEKLEQAMQMQKDQIKKAYKAHHDLGHIYGLDSEQYYNETYGVQSALK